MITLQTPAAGSATLWVYSTLLLQQRVPNSLLGRVSGEAAGRVGGRMWAERHSLSAPTSPVGHPPRGLPSHQLASWAQSCLPRPLAAIEMALYTVTESASSVFGGAAALLAAPPRPRKPSTHMIQCF